jgi:dimethylargininase
MNAFTKAIVRTPCPEMVHGITTASLGKPDYILALEQHRKYIEALKSLGLEVTVLEADSRFPDSVFVEDVALCTKGLAVITFPGAVSRRGEEKEMAGELDAFYNKLWYIEFPGTLDGGDVMRVGSHYYIGLSDRTNRSGADQCISVLEQNGLSGETVEVEGLLHLKSGVSYLEENVMLVGKELMNLPAFAGFRKIGVPWEEAYAANSVWVNGTVLVPAGFPVTRERIEQAGFNTLALDMSEFQKLDGGLSCLSLRF